MQLVEVFIDTSAWIALSDADDTHYQSAVKTYGRMRNARAALITTNLVIAESYEGIRRAGGHRWATRFLERVRSGPRVVKVFSDMPLEEQAEVILRRYDDQTFSFVDAVSFAVMRERRIADAFAFDRHFESAGFTLLPSLPIR